MATGAGAVTFGDGTAGNNVLLNLSGAQTWTNNAGSAFTINNTAATFTRQTGAALTFNKVGAGNFAVTSGVTLANGIVGPWAFFGTGSSQRYATITAGNVAGLTGTTAANVNNLGSASTNYELTTGGTNGTVGGRTANTIRYAGAAASLSLYNGAQANSYDLTLNGILAVGTGTFQITRSSVGAADAGLIIGATGELVIDGSQAVTISAPIQEGGAGRRLTYSGSNTLTLSGVNTYTGTTTVSSGTLRLSNALALQNSPLNTNGSIAGDSTNGLKTTLTALTLGGLTGNKDLVSLFTTTAGGYGSVADLTLNPGTGASNSYSGVIANGAAGMTLTKSGAGTQMLSSANLYTGATTISAGTLQLGAAGTTGTLDTGSAIVNNGILAINRTNAVVQGTDFYGAAITGTGGFTQAGSGTTTLNAANTFAGTTTVSAGKMIMTNPLALQNSAYNTTGSNGTTIGLDVTSGLSSGTLTLGGLSGGVDLASAFTAGYTGSVSNLTLNPQTGVSNIYSGIIADSTPAMALTKTGDGTQTLSSANTYTGATTISGGTLVLNNATALGDTPGVNGTSSISMAAGTTLRSDYIIVDAVNIDSFAYAPITLTGTGSVNFHIGAGNGTAPAEAVTFNLNGAVGGTAGTNVVFSSSSANLGNADSTFVLGVASTYNGNTTITAGNSNDRINVKAGVADALPTTTVLTFDNFVGGGTGRISQYDLNGNNQTLAGLSNGGVVPNLRNHRVTNSGALATLTINNSADFTFGGTTLSGGSTSRGQILGNTALVKSGAGTFTLSGTLTGGATAGGNTYNGGTTINGGTLRINSRETSATGAVTVGGASATGSPTLAGTGTVGGNVTIATAGGGAAGTLAPGSGGLGNLILNTKTLAFGSGSTASFEVDADTIANRDRVTGISALAYGGKLQITATGTLSAGDTWDLFDFSSQSNTFDNNSSFGTDGTSDPDLPDLGAGLTWQFDYTTGTLSVAASSGFAAWQSANSTAGGLDDDHDGDGVSNGIEFFIYGPVANSGFTALPSVTNTGGTLSVTWTHPAGYTETYGPGGYEVEVSSTLGSWVPAVLGAGPNEVDITTVPGDVKYTFPAGTKNFARLKVTGP